MRNIFAQFHQQSDLLSSKLFSEETFYQAFQKDLNKTGHEVVIESPFITNRRLALLLPTLEKLKERRVRVIINTRDPQELDDGYHRSDAHEAIAKLQHVGIQVLYTAGHHRKIIIIDRQILYEGSLNVLSQNDSCEIMRRIESSSLAWQWFDSLRLISIFKSMRYTNVMSGFELTSEDIQAIVRWLEINHPENANEEYARAMILRMKQLYRQVGWADPDKLEDFYSEYIQLPDSKKSE